MSSLTEDEIREEMEKYWEELKVKAHRALEVARLARERGLDPELDVETTFTTSVADRVEKFVGPRGIAKVIEEYEKQGKEREEIAIDLAIRIASGEYTDERDPEKLADQALRTSLALLTESVTAAPLEGIAKVKIKENSDGSKYLAVYYAGPIRSAGGTEAALTVVLADIIRQVLGLDRFKPTEKHIKRYIEERDLYGRVASYQTPAKAERVEKAIELCPIEITGEATEDMEVKGNRDVPGVETNKLRGGAMLIINDGLVGRAKKLLKKVEKIRKIYGDRFDLKRVDELVEALYGKHEEESSVEEEEEERDVMWILEDDDAYYEIVQKHNFIPSIEEYPHYYKYLNEMVIGRPVLAYPGRPGGFRLRYGRSRVTGFAAVGIHPATMAILDDFLVPGTQIKMQGPGKGAVVMPVDTIEGPIVLLKDGTVKQLKTREEAERVKQQIEKILFLGDILIAVGEFIENKTSLRLPGYCEERRYEEAKLKVKNPPKDFDSAQEAYEFSKRYNVPLHPKYTHYRRLITVKQLKRLRERLNFSSGEYDEEVKRILEEVGVQHHLEGNRIVIDDEIVYILLGRKDVDREELEKDSCTLRVLSKISGVRIRDKAGTFIGARMGRPEKAKMRAMKHAFHVLFPVSDKSFKREIKDLEGAETVVDLATFKCPQCNRITHIYFCPHCLASGDYVRTVPISVKGPVKEGTPAHKAKPGNGKPYTKFVITPETLAIYKKIAERMDVQRDPTIKGVRGLMNERREPEFLIKGFLRKKHEISEFKDATVRFDATNVPITHFRPREIHVSVEKLKELGYTRDVYGNPLERDDQLVELKPQDVILPREGLETLRRVSQFIDELLVKVYGLKPFYNAKKPEDLIGHLVVGLSPHTSAGIIGRIIGRVNTRTGLAHPYRHAAKRRNADGDEDAFMLLLDVLINFSRHFLPEKRGGKMDAPLVIQLILDPSEVDDEVHNMDVHRKVPLRLYAAAILGKDPDSVEEVETVEKRLGTRRVYMGLGFTHDTSGFDYGVYVNFYSASKDMFLKFIAQRRLEERIRAVDAYDTAKRLADKHVLRDIIGNFREYAKQPFYCRRCNKSFRRPTVSGNCPICGSKLRPTIAYKSVVKYAKILEHLEPRINDEYTRQKIRVVLLGLKDYFGKLEYHEEMGSLLTRVQEELPQRVFGRPVPRL